MDDDYSELAISEAAYGWSVRAFSIVKQLLGVNIKLHDDLDQVSSGDIYLFNHFARFETFIPQYLIFQHNGAYCRAVAASELFAQEAMGSYLRSVGAVPHDHPRLLPFLAGEIMRGRKVVVFPEGGMVKDRRVRDEKGGYSIYSRIADERRKQHRGAAVLGLALDAFKTLLTHAESNGRRDWIKHLAGELRFDSVDELIAAVRKPTVIVPSNITFYPIRISDNFLIKGVELFNRGLSRRASEELLIESNILLRDTDMDIRFGAPIKVGTHWRWWERKLLQRAADRLSSLDDLFGIPEHLGGWDTRVLAQRLRRRSERLRDLYMHEMYINVTVNLSHLAATLVFRLLAEGCSQIERHRFFVMLYLGIKHVQGAAGVNLHRSLCSPDAYQGLLADGCEGLRQFVENSQVAQLIAREHGEYRFSDKLRERHHFDEVRLENVVEVYANEVEPLQPVADSIARAVREADSANAKALAALRLHDRHLEYRWDSTQFAKARHAEINAAQTATEPADWFWLMPRDPRAAVVLVHGFLASPAEMRGLGESLFEQGYAVLGVRLRGHGTSPWDLRERSWRDWYRSVEQGLTIASAYCNDVHLVGFSTGGALALRLAAREPAQIRSVCAVSVPIRFRDRNMMFVPLVHGANRLVGWMSSFEGVMPFVENESEHPNINYRHIPVRGLHELRLLVAELESCLGDIETPTLVLQGDEDPVVVPDSAPTLFGAIAAHDKRLQMVCSTRHGILYEDIDATRSHIADFIEQHQHG